MSSYFNRKDLVYTVYREGSISKAAQKLFVSQPSLSIMIRKIEEEVGVPLFDRTSKPLRLTQAGEEYVKAAEAIAHIEKDFENYVNACSQLLTGSLTIGANQLLSSLVLPDYVARFIRRYPGVELHMVDDNPTVLENQISSGQLDLVIDNKSMDSEVFEQRLFRTERLLLAVPAEFECNAGLEEYRLQEQDILSGSYLVSDVKPVPLERFQGVPFISMTKDNDTRRRTDAMFHEAGVSPEMILEIDRLVTLYNFVEIGTAASVVSDTLVCNIRHHWGKVAFYALQSPHAKRDIYVSYKRSRYYSRAMNAFMELLFDESEENV